MKAKQMKSIKSFKINHKKLIPGVYLHDVKSIGGLYATTFDLRFKKPNSGKYLSNIEMHSLEHLIATYFTNTCKEKIYFGPMGCQTGFYYVVSGKKNLKWLLNKMLGLNKYINDAQAIPGNNSISCGNYQTLNLKAAKDAWNKWYSQKDIWGKKY